MRKRAWMTMATILILSVVSGCSVDKGTNPGDPTLRRTTPEGLIEFFADSYERKDIAKYGESLADTYLFVFTTEDADSLGLPADEPWWGKNEDVASTTRMFEDPEVTTIEMEMTIDTGPWPTEDGLGYRLDPSIKVTIDTGEGEPTTYWVFSSWLYVEVIVDPYDESLWVFNEIAEQPKEGGLVVALGGE